MQILNIIGPVRLKSDHSFAIWRDAKCRRSFFGEWMNLACIDVLNKGTNHSFIARFQAGKENLSSIRKKRRVVVFLDSAIR